VPVKVALDPRISLDGVLYLTPLVISIQIGEQVGVQLALALRLALGLDRHCRLRLPQSIYFNELFAPFITTTI
jgi:hypothetical protein